MDRDMDLIRKILLQIKDAKNLDGVNVVIEGCSEEVINYHNMLLLEADLIKGYDYRCDDGIEITPTRLTWKGHEFIDNASNNEIWEEAKNISGRASFSILTALLTDLVKKSVGL